MTREFYEYQRIAESVLDNYEDLTGLKKELARVNTGGDLELAEAFSKINKFLEQVTGTLDDLGFETGYDD